ncbi:NADH-quinone oxidoreductase subunit M [Buchnera aphidicola (Neophyllaphis varicolor)]|uniref:complex I subunit 4 family protein n=1 Tax=Buchnera aphidicola TaxID=9 RepID=UPI0031B89BAB
MILVLLIIIPILGSLFCLSSECFNKKFPRFFALITILTTFIISIYIWIYHFLYFTYHTYHSKWTLEFSESWISRFNINFHLGLDGLSLIMIILTNILGIISIIVSWDEIKKSTGLFYFNLIIILCCVLGIFVSLDLFLLFLFWELILIPIYFLISFWGYNKKYRINAANKFFIYSQVSGIMLLVSILGLAINFHSYTNLWTFDYNLLIKTPMPIFVEYVLMFCFFISFAIKMPIVPFHSWLPEASTYAPTAGSIDLSAILVKTAVYCLLRFCVCLFPNASIYFTDLFMFLGLISIFYGAFMAFLQNDIKRIISYSAISHMGFILIAIYTGSKLSLQGVMIQIICSSLSIAALFILSGQIYTIFKTRKMYELGGLWTSHTFIASLFIFFIFANLSIPFTGNFIGEFLILLGSFYKFPIITFFASCSLIISSVYYLSMLQNICFGIVKNKYIFSKNFIKEYIISIFILIVLIFFGLCPKYILYTTSYVIFDIYKYFNCFISIKI